MPSGSGRPRFLREVSLDSRSTDRNAGLGVYFVMAGIGLLVLRLNRPGFAGSRSWRSRSADGLGARSGRDIARLICARWYSGAWCHVWPRGLAAPEVPGAGGGRRMVFRGGALRPAMAAGASRPWRSLLARSRLGPTILFRLAPRWACSESGCGDETVAVPAPSEGRWRLPPAWS